MLPLTNSRVYLALGTTDMRKAINKEIIAFHLTNEENYRECIDYLERMVRLLQKKYLAGRKSENMSRQIMNSGSYLIQ